MLRPLMTTAALAATILAVSPAFPQDSNAPDQAQPAQAAPLDKADADFLQKTQERELVAMQASKDVAQRGMDPAVRAFAQRMVDEHTKTEKQLTDLAQQKGLNLPQTMTDDYRKKVDDLAKKQGAELDRAYLDLIVSQHDKEITDYQKRAKDAKDANVRTFAATQLPMMRTHLDEAKALQKQIKSTK